VMLRWRICNLLHSTARPENDRLGRTRSTMRTVNLWITTDGKAKKCGPDVYRVPAGDLMLALLESNGWKFLHREFGVPLMQAPAGRGTKRPVVSVSIPETDEILALATDLHKKHQKWKGEAFGWPSSYEPGGPRELRVLFRGDDNHPHCETVTQTMPSFFSIGDGGWYVSIQWKDGSEPEYKEDISHVVKEAQRRPLISVFGDLVRKLIRQP